MVGRKDDLPWIVFYPSLSRHSLPLWVAPFLAGKSTYIPSAGSLYIRTQKGGMLVRYCPSFFDASFLPFPSLFQKKHAHI